MLKTKSFLFAIPPWYPLKFFCHWFFIVGFCKLKYPIASSSVLTTCTISPSSTFTHPHSHFCTIASFWIPKVSVIIVATNLVTLAHLFLVPHHQIISHYHFTSVSCNGLRHKALFYRVSAGSFIHVLCCFGHKSDSRKTRSSRPRERAHTPVNLPLYCYLFSYGGWSTSFLHFFL